MTSSNVAAIDAFSVTYYSKTFWVFVPIVCALFALLEARVDNQTTNQHTVAQP